MSEFQPKPSDVVAVKGCLVGVYGGVPRIDISGTEATLTTLGVSLAPWVPAERIAALEALPALLERARGILAGEMVVAQHEAEQGYDAFGTPPFHLKFWAQLTSLVNQIRAAQDALAATREENR
jgi:hypothetical protein